jgi:hypothetical protein
VPELYHHYVKFAVAIDQQFQGIGLVFQHLELFARRAAKGGLFGGDPSRSKPIGAIFR